MDTKQVLQNQNTPSENQQPMTSTLQQPEIGKSNKKTLRIIVYVLIAITLLATGTFGLWLYQEKIVKKSKPSPASLVTPTPSPLTIPTAKLTSRPELLSPSPVPQKPLTENSLSYTNIDGKVFLRHGGTIYSENDVRTGEPKEANLNINDYSWIWILEVPRDRYWTDGLFNFKTFPDREKFVYVIRLSFEEEGLHKQILTAYIYDLQENENNKIFFFSSPEDKYAFARVNSITSDGNFIDFTMFGCWNCGGHKPETLLYDVKKKNHKRIGKVIDFQWLESGKYQYKDYIVTPCDEPQPGECFKNSEDLPLKFGQF